jgi:lactaldehyde reductase
MICRTILNETSYFGKGAIKEIANEVINRGLKKVMLVTDKDLLKFKVATKVCDILDEAKIDYEIYDKIKANPTIKNVTEGVDFCKQCGADVIVAVGGGSAIDTSKAIAIIMKNPEFADVRSLEGASPTKHKAMPIIAVSTTSGTAAEPTPAKDNSTSFTSAKNTPPQSMIAPSPKKLTHAKMPNKTTIPLGIAIALSLLALL